MNILAFTIGFIVAIIVIVRFRKSRLEKNRLAYSMLLISFPFYYFGFAIYGNNYATIPLEFLGGLIFFVIALLSLKLDDYHQFSLLAFGYILHGVYDITHDMLFINAGMPSWWPEFCGVIDIVIGLYLVSLAFRSRVKLV